MKKLPPPYLRLALPAGTSFVMTCLVSGVATYRALGLINGVIGIWLSSWMISWAIAFPTMYFVMPHLRRLLTRVIEEN